MNPWYEQAFSREYLTLYSHRDDQEAAADVADLVRLVDPPQMAPLLDLCCGPGRHLVALGKRGFTQLTGLDLSLDLLQEARARLRRAHIRDVRLIHSDMREIPDVDFYHTVVSLFTSFGYFADIDQNRRVLASALRALIPGGRLALDTLNRDYVAEHLVPSETRVLDGRRIVIHRRMTENGCRVEKTTRIIQPGSPERVHRESVHMYRKPDIEALLHEVGFAGARFYGSLDGQPYSARSPRLVLVATKAVRG